MVSPHPARRRPARTARRTTRPPAGDSAGAETRRQRLLAAAAVEFAARGFDGAKVDRIADRAGVNKALLYYYFHSKAALYREILLDVFRTVAAAVAAIHAQGGTPEEQLSGFIHAVADQTVRQPMFPNIWLREMAEGGRHVDEPIVLELRKVLETLSTILRDGTRTGVFVDANPFVTQIAIVAPLLLFSATAPLRERFSHLKAPHLSAIPRDVIVDHVRTATLAALGAGQASRSGRSVSRSRRESS